MTMFDKFELGIIERSLERLTRKMRESEFVGEADPHLLKCEALHIKAKELAK